MIHIMHADVAEIVIWEGEDIRIVLRIQQMSPSPLCLCLSL